MAIRTGDTIVEGPIDAAVSASGVSWGAVIAGAAVAAALSYALLILGTGLGLSSTSPYSYEGVSITTLGVGAIVWLTFTQVASSAFGGYVAGRLRILWPTVHTDEVYFRDTAHGFLTWAVASLFVAALLASALAGLFRSGTTIAAAGAAGAGATATKGASHIAERTIGDSEDPNSAYFVDRLLRQSVTPPNSADASTLPAPETAPRGYANAEASRILATSIANGQLDSNDQQYLARVVATRANISEAEANQRVGQAFADMKASMERAKQKAKDAADAARKATAGLAIWMFFALLCGAFSGSFAATIGGRQRDRNAAFRARTL